jgi:hypothetical protein
MDRAPVAGTDDVRDCQGCTPALGIPVIADRVVQAALKLVLEPIFEADFMLSYGFRPGRRAQDAIAEIHMLGERHGETDRQQCRHRAPCRLNQPELRILVSGLRNSSSSASRATGL